METEIASSSSPGVSTENTVVKDENGQDICCVVCGDKSTGSTLVKVGTMIASIIYLAFIIYGAMVAF